MNCGLCLSSDTTFGPAKSRSEDTNIMKNKSVRLLIRNICLFSISGLLIFAPMMAGAVIPPAERLLPADTLFVVSVPDSAHFLESCSNAPLGQLINDPAMKPFRDKFLEAWKKQFAEPLERELSVKLEDYGDLLQGQFTFAITQNGWNGGNEPEPATLLLLDTKEKSNQLKTNLTELHRKWVDSGRTVRTETVRGVDLWVVPMSSNNVPDVIQRFLPQKQEVHEKGEEDEPQSISKGELVIGQYESLLMVGDSVKGVEQVVARLTGGSIPALAEEASFESNQGAMFRDALMFAWCNAKRFFDVFLALPPEEPNPEAPSPLPALNLANIINATGLGGLTTIAAAWNLNSEGSAIDLFIGNPESKRAGIFKILDADARDSSPPPFVPADVLKFQRWRMDGQKALATLEKMLSDFSPQALSVWNLLISTGDSAGKLNDPDFDLRKNLFGNLGDDFISYTKLPRSNSERDLASPPSILLIGSPRPENFAASLKGLLAIISPTVQPDERDFLGKKIYTVTVSRSVIGMSQPVGGKLSYAASGSYVAISSDATILEEYLRSSENPPKPLRELSGLVEAAQKVGGQGTGLFNYENQAEQMRIAFQLAKLNPDKSSESSPELSMLTSSIPFARPELSMKGWLDYSLLPDFDRISKYFLFSIYASKASSEGITYKFFVPTPPTLRK